MTVFLNAVDLAPSKDSKVVMPSVVLRISDSGSDHFFCMSMTLTLELILGLGLSGLLSFSVPVQHFQSCLPAFPLSGFYIPLLLHRRQRLRFLAL